jgi:8-oxo-dGTP pyrophosphatase MutT (NUDIX family)
MMTGVRLAATVILARSPFEVYLTRRSARSAFAPDAFVFPGGTVDAQDASPVLQRRTLGLDAARLRDEFRATVDASLSSSEPPIAPDQGASLLVAALRELFEEAGILLARDAAGNLVSTSSVEGLDAQRVAVRTGAMPFAEFLERHDWYADAATLTLFSHWITPPVEPRRYNTHFFFAIAPPSQDPLADAHETHDGIWIAPSAALERYAQGAMHLVYPTIKHLERLRAFGSANEAAEYARSKSVLTIMPHAPNDGDFKIPQALENTW